jgi:PAS domain S-box-containing protein
LPRLLAMLLTQGKFVVDAGRENLFSKPISGVIRSKRAMAHRDLPSLITTIRRYGVAVISVGIALTLALLLGKGFDVRGCLFLVAIATTVWVAGAGPGFLAIVLSTLSLERFFRPPLAGFHSGLGHLPYLTFFTILAVAISLLTRSRRQIQESLQHTRSQLETEVAERTAELRRTATELKAILDASPVGIALLSRDLTVQHCNPAFERIVGWTASEITGQRLYVLKGTQAMPGTLTEKLIREQEFVNNETRLVRKDGSQFDASLAWALVQDEAGKPPGFLVTIEDISDRKRAEETLRQARADLARINRVTTMGELTASLAHEIRQPIAAAVTNAKACVRWLQREQPDLAEAREAAGRLVNDATRAAEIISHIRSLFQNGTPQRDLLDVNDVIREMHVLLYSEAARYSVSIRNHLAAEIPKVPADRVQLQQVLLNLMINAIDAMREMGAGELTITSQIDGAGQLLVSVSDTGVGLPKQADEIFNAFFTTKPHGTGMGLPISRSIIESHGGRLWATTNSERGATFHFTLPMEGEVHA